MKPKSLSLFSPRSSCNGIQESVSTSAGCIVKIFRRILCFNSISSSPFDHIQENEEENSLEIGELDNLGIVARLMGLESLPESISSPQKRTQRRIPAYQELEDENFFILSFENSRNITKNVRRRRRRRRESSKEINKENEDLNMVSKGSLDLDSCMRNQSGFEVDINPRKVVCPMKNSCQKLEKLRKNIEISEGDSENSSPNSVLEFVDFPNDQETAASSSGDNSRFSNSKLRRTLSQELNSCGESKDKSFINNGYGRRQRELRNKHQIYAENPDQITRLAAKEMIKSRWVYEEISKNQHYFWEIGRDIASDILDLLLDELLIN